MHKPVADIGYDLVSDLLGGETAEEVLSKYSITPEQFNEFKASFLTEARGMFPSLSMDSRAVAFFKRLRNSRRCTTWFKERGIDLKWRHFLSEILKGSSRPSYGLIFALREHIPPSMWYYSEKSKIPNPVVFRPANNGSEYTSKIRKELSETPSCALSYFAVLRNRKKTAEFFEQHNLEYNNVKCYLYMKGSEEGKKRIIRPSFDFVSKLKDDVQPDWWYIYPGEVSPRSLAQLEMKAEEFCRGKNIPRFPVKKLVYKW